MEEMTNKDEKIKLITGKEFEEALISAAEVKNQKLSMCKSRNKDNYSRFYELMLASRQDIQSILNKKKRERTDDDNNKYKEFKKTTSQAYKQTCDILVPEELEDGELTKVQKMVQRITNVLKVLNYIGNSEIENEFKKYGVELKYKKMNEEEVFSQDHIHDEVNRIFDQGKKIQEEINSNNEEIKTNIYENSVPIDLQYDKSQNPTGIKNSDFCKLVDLKAKYLMAQDNEAKEKVDEKANNMAGDIIFQNKRNEILNQKLMDIASFQENNE